MAEEDAHEGREERKDAAVPDFVYWLILLVAVIGVSSAGSMFQEVDEVPPILRASYRLQVTSIVLVVPAIVQWRQLKPELRANFVMRKSLLILGASGLFVGAHLLRPVGSNHPYAQSFRDPHPLVIVVDAFGHRLHKPVIIPMYTCSLTIKMRLAAKVEAVRDPQGWRY